MKNKLTVVVSIAVCLLMVLSVFTACSAKKINGEESTGTLVADDNWFPDGENAYQPAVITDVELVELISKALGDQASDFDGSLSSLSEEQIEKVKQVAQREGYVVDTDDNGNTIIKKNAIPTTAVPASVANEILTEAGVNKQKKLTDDEYSKVSKVAEDKGVSAVTNKNGDVTMVQKATSVIPASEVNEIYSRAGVTNRTNLSPEEYSKVSKVAEDRNVSAIINDNGDVTMVQIVTEPSSAPIVPASTGSAKTESTKKDESKKDESKKDESKSSPSGTTAFTVAPTSKPSTTAPTTKASTTLHTTSPSQSTTSPAGPGITQPTQHTKAIDNGFATAYSDGSDCLFKGSTAVSDGVVAVGITTKDSSGKIKEYSSGLIVKFNSEGKQKWTDIVSGDDIISYESVAVLTDGSIVAAGYTLASNFVSDAEYKCKDTVEGIIVKYSPDGKVQWKKTFGGSGDDILYTIAATSDGGFVIGGTSDSIDFDMNNVSDGHTAVVAKYDGNGNLKWKTGLTGQKSGTVNDVAVSPDGSIYATIETINKTGDYEQLYNPDAGARYSVVMKISPTGSIAWKNGMYENGSLYAKAVAATPDGGCLVAGEYSLKRGEGYGTFTIKGKYNGGQTGSFDIFIVKYKSNGERDWINTLVGFENDRVTDIVPVSNGFILAGYTTSTDRDYTFGNKGDYDSFIVSFTSGGTKQAVKSFAGSNPDRVMSVAANGGTIYACGSSTSSDGDFKECPSDGTNANAFMFSFKMNLA